MKFQKCIYKNILTNSPIHCNFPKNKLLPWCITIVTGGAVAAVASENLVLSAVDKSAARSNARIKTFATLKAWFSGAFVAPFPRFPKENSSPFCFDCFI